MAVTDWNTTAANNTTVGGVSIAEGWSPASVNNAIRGMMSEVATWRDVQIAALAPKASPTLTGVPTAPTAAFGTNTTQIATTAFVAAASFPVGSVIMHAASTPPAGYLECDGAAVSRTTYAALFAAIGTSYGTGDSLTTFNLPQMRGEFPRGWDNGRGVDSGRAFGSAQDSQLGSHNHSYSRVQNGGSGQPGGSGGSLLGQTTGNTGGTSNASETRPRNIVFLFCIKT